MANRRVGKITLGSELDQWKIFFVQCNQRKALPVDGFERFKKSKPFHDLARLMKNFRANQKF